MLIIINSPLFRSKRQNRNTVDNFKELVLFAYNIYSDFSDEAKKKGHNLF